jgi:hypothetical protein
MRGAAGAAYHDSVRRELAAIDETLAAAHTQCGGDHPVGATFVIDQTTRPELRQCQEARALEIARRDRARCCRG